MALMETGRHKTVEICSVQSLLTSHGDSVMDTTSDLVAWRIPVKLLGDP